MRVLMLATVWIGFIEQVVAQSSRGRPEHDYEGGTGFILLGIALLVIGWGVVMNVVERFKKGKSKDASSQDR